MTRSSLSLPLLVAVAFCMGTLTLTLLAASVAAQNNPSVFRIAVVLHITNDNTSFIFNEPQPGNSFYATYLSSLQPMVAAARMWGDLINRTGGIHLWDQNNTMIPVDIQFFNAGPSTCPNEPGLACVTRASQLATDLATANGPYGNFSGIVAPGFSLDPIVSTFMLACETTRSCLAVAPLTPSSSVFVCQEPLPDDCKRSGNRRFQYGFSVLYDGNYALSAHLTIMRQKQFFNIAVLGSSLAYGVQAAQTTQDTIASLGMNTVDAWIFDNETTIDYDTALAKVQWWIDNQVQALCILSNGADSVAVSDVVQLVHAMKDLNWLPSAVAIGGSISSILVNYLSSDDMAYWMTAAQWDWHLNGRAYNAYNTTYNLELFPATQAMSSPSVFRQKFVDYTGIPYSDSLLVYGADSVQALNFFLKFAELASAADIELMRAASRSVSSPTIAGQLQLDAFGRTVVSDQLVFQSLQNGSRIILSPLSIGVDPILPIPNWDERAFTGDFVTSVVEQLSTVTAALGCVYTMLLMAGFVRYRQHAVIKAATPSFCLLVTLGGLMMQASVFATGLYSTNHSCQAEIWLLTMGFSLMFTALFARTFRVWRIFHRAQRLKQVRITNCDLLMQLGGVILFDIVLNVTWQAVAPMNAVYVAVDQFRPSHDYYECDIRGHGGTFALVSMAQKGCLLIAGIVLTYLCRGVPSKFNETPFLAAAIYNCALLSSFIVAIVATQIGGRTVTYAVQVFGIQLAVFSTLSILFMPKFNLILFDNEKLKQFGVQDTDELIARNANKNAIQGGKIIDVQQRNHRGSSHERTASLNKNKPNPKVAPMTNNNNNSSNIPNSSSSPTPRNGSALPKSPARPSNTNKVSPHSGLPHPLSVPFHANQQRGSQNESPSLGYSRLDSVLSLDPTTIDDAELLRTQKLLMEKRAKFEAALLRVVNEVEVRRAANGGESRETPFAIDTATPSHRHNAQSSESVSQIN